MTHTIEQLEEMLAVFGEGASMEARDMAEEHAEDLARELIEAKWALADLREAMDVDKAAYAAAVKWCGEKDRETSMDDIKYFLNNWRSLPGLGDRVDREIGARARAAIGQKP